MAHNKQKLSQTSRASRVGYCNHETKHPKKSRRNYRSNLLTMNQIRGRAIPPRRLWKMDLQSEGLLSVRAACARDQPALLSDDGRRHHGGKRAGPWLHFHDPTAENCGSPQAHRIGKSFAALHMSARGTNRASQSRLE